MGYAAATGLRVRRDLAIGSAGTFTGASFLHTQGFNDVGGLASTTYPCPSAGCAPALERTVNYKYDNGLLYEVGGWARLAYQSNGMLAEVTHGRTVNNAFEATARETWDADPDGMSRPREIKARKEGGAQHWSSGAYAFDGTGNIAAIGATAYAYDAFGRLVRWTNAPAGGGTFATQMAYDAFGNQLYSAVSGCGPSTNGRIYCYTNSILARTIDGTTNRYTGVMHDAAGNVLADGQRTFTYDGLNMTTSATVGANTYRYLYDANDERVAAFEILPAGNRTTWTLRGFRHELLRVWTQEPGSSTLTWKEDEIWRGTSLLGLATPQGRRHYALDHLGSPRAVLDDNGDLLALQNFEPFGSGGMTGTGTLQFTGHERDRASIGGGVVDLPDYAHARSLDTGGGRFLSVDPILGTPSRPQSWNRYSYVENNPISAIDPTGMKMECVTKDDGTEECTVIPDDPLPDPLPHPDPAPDWVYKFQGALNPILNADGEKKLHADMYWRSLWNPTQMLTGEIMVPGVGNAGRALLGTSRINLLQHIKNPRLRNLINQLYRPNAQVGTGSTADAIRYEVRTGIMLSRAGHFQKGLEMRTALVRVLRQESLTAAERQAVRAVLIDLQRSLSGL